MIASMMLTIVIVTSWLGENKPPTPGSPVESEEFPSPPNPGITIRSSGASECPPMSDFMMRHPDATADEMYEIEQCNRDIAHKTGLDGLHE
jgi:hypothetical protein